MRCGEEPLNSLPHAQSVACPGTGASCLSQLVATEPTQCAAQCTCMYPFPRPARKGDTERGEPPPAVRTSFQPEPVCTIVSCPRAHTSGRFCAPLFRTVVQSRAALSACRVLSSFPASTAHGPWCPVVSPLPASGVLYLYTFIPPDHDQTPSLRSHACTL